MRELWRSWRSWLVPGVVGGLVGGLVVALVLLHGPGGVPPVTPLAGGADPEDGYVLGWGTLALLNAGLAQTKGHGGLGWFLLSLLLGPLVTLLLVLVESPRDRRERAEAHRSRAEQQERRRTTG